MERPSTNSPKRFLSTPAQLSLDGTGRKSAKLNPNFDFGKGSYGPFSEDVKAALHDFANRNWLNEQPLGRMVELQLDLNI